ncbi:hypothetical protein C8R45DRAFT_1022315 [Mycena sanguinolenta]|nr:hypothetical protein C8R45DRAFT_1022315 [Mycena sanguinolenta]
MSGNDAEAAGAGVCGLCSVCMVSIFEPWCNTKAFGGAGGNRMAGCCGSCCNKLFNEDSMDKWDKGPESHKEKSVQPGPSPPMKVEAPDAEHSPSSTNPTTAAVAGSG